MTLVFGIKRKSKESTDPETDNSSKPRLKDGLKRTRSGLFAGLFKKKAKHVFDADTLEELEDHLLLADVGMQTTDQVMHALRESKDHDEADARALMKQVLLPTLEPVQQSLNIDTENRPF